MGGTGEGQEHAGGKREWHLVWVTCTTFYPFQNEWACPFFSPQTCASQHRSMETHWWLRGLGGGKGKYFPKPPGYTPPSIITCNTAYFGTTACCDRKQHRIWPLMSLGDSCWSICPHGSSTKTQQNGKGHLSYIKLRLHTWKKSNSLEFIQS